MAVAIVIDDEWEVPRCLPWSGRFARAADESLTVILLQDGKQPQCNEIGEGGDNHSALVQAVLNYVQADSHMRLHQHADAPDPAPSSSELASSGSVGENDQGENDQGENDQGENDQGGNDEESEDQNSPAAAPSAPTSAPNELTSAEAAPKAIDSGEHPVALGPPLAVRVFELSGADKAKVLLDFVAEQDTSLLIIPRHASERGLDPELPWEQQAFRRVSCATMLLRPAEEPSKANQDRVLSGVLAPVHDSRPSVISLRWAQRLRNQLEQDLTALYVEPDVGELAPDVGARIVQQIVKRSIPSANNVQAEAAVGASVRETIRDYAVDGGHQLVVLGANRMGVGRRWLRSSITEWLMGQRFGPTVAVIRPPIPFAHRLTAQCANWLMQRVPQLDRESRVSLYERIQNSSRWDFDFIALICLSTMIASLGLIQNSSAVVIGAMLVAPLMTPIVGAGLALVQGNRVLIQAAWATVLRGFLLAFFLAMAIGYCLPGLSESQEMLARGSPNILDLVVALISGVAASYALGRPNLYSALPGVAIAAALVPPVATAGLAISLGNFSLAGGALLLFTTNIVAIVLGTAMALFAVGIRPSHEHGVVESWVYRIAAILIVIASVIAAYEFVPHHALPESVEAEIETILAQHGPARLSDARQPSSDLVQLTIHSPAPLGESVRNQLAASVRKYLQTNVRVQIETRLVTIQSPP